MSFLFKKLIFQEFLFLAIFGTTNCILNHLIMSNIPLYIFPLVLFLLNLIHISDLSRDVIYCKD